MSENTQEITITEDQNVVITQDSPTPEPTLTENTTPKEKVKKLSKRDEIKVSSITANELYSMLSHCKISGEQIKKIEVTTSFDFDKIITNFKQRNDQLIGMRLQEVNQKLANKLESKTKSTVPVIIQKLHNSLANVGWNLTICELGYLWAKKTFKPEMPITKAQKNGNIFEFPKPIGKLKEIQVRLSDPKLYIIKVFTSPKNIDHPNVMEDGYACTGTLHGQPIKLKDTKYMISILESIEKTYLLPNLDSAHNPKSTTNAKILKQKKGWDARRS